MAELTYVANLFSALAAARSIVGNIDTGLAKYYVADDNQTPRDASEELRDVQLQIINILEDVTRDKERRKTSRRPA